MTPRQEQIAWLRAMAKHCRESARVAQDRGLTWPQAWEMHLECTRPMVDDPVKYNDAVCDGVSQGGTPEDFVKLQNESADQYERQADQLEKETT